jgi:hypothetical protein
MLNRNFLEDLKTLESKRNESETVKANYAGAVILLLVAAGFLVLVFVLDQALDFSRFAY